MKRRYLIAGTVLVGGVYMAKRRRRPAKRPKKIPITIKEDEMLYTSFRDIISHLQTRVVGQDRAIAQLEHALKVCEAGIGDPDRPVSVLLFAGPTGTGKTETVHALAEAIHQDREFLCRVDCNLLSERHTALALSGAPPSYVGYGHKTLLDKKKIEGKVGRPGILLLDEVEKAHPVVHQSLLQIFDKGVMAMNGGYGEINFRNCIIIMTSNVGSGQLSKMASGVQTGFHIPSEVKHNLPGKERKSVVFNALKREFPPEFLNRLDYVVVFKWLTDEELIVIIDKFLEELADRLAVFPYYLSVSHEAKRFMVQQGFDLRYGARPLKRSLRKHLESPLAELIADGIPNHAIIRVVKEFNRLRITVKDPSLFLLKTPPKGHKKPRSTPNKPSPG